MRTAGQIIEELAALGVTMKANGDRLRIEPASRVPADLISRIREAKPALLETLRKRPATCAASCYEVEPGRWIHHSWDGCRTIPPAAKAMKVERQCWHCEGGGRCDCAACDGQCAPCRGSGKLFEWVN